MSIATSEAITLLEESFSQDYAVIAGAALIFFDHVITFSQEVQLFWGERSFSAWLFFANRMPALVYASMSVWSVTNIYTVTSCMANFVASGLVSLLIATISQAVAILRVYAVTGGGRRPVMLLTLLMVINQALNTYGEFNEVSCFVVVLARTAICSSSSTSSSAQYISAKLGIVNATCATIAVTTTLAILWSKLYSHHRLATADLLSTRNPPLAVLLLRDGTIQLTALLLLDLLRTVLKFVNSTAAYVVAYLEYSLTPVLISRILLNVRAAARSTRGEQSQTPSFVRSKRGVQTQADIENMSFELNILSSTEQAPETDRALPQDSIEHDQIVAEPRNMANNIVTAGDAHQEMNEEEGMDDVEEEMWSNWEDDE